MDKGTAAAVVEVAKSQVGYIEGPGDNETIYGDFMHADFLPWCGSFVNWVFNEAGVKLPSMVATAIGAHRMKEAGKWLKPTDKPRAGDLCFMDFPHDGVDRISHIGIVIDASKNVVTLIEGNTSLGGSQRNGGEVMVKLRKLGAGSAVVGFARPKFIGASLSKPVKEMVHHG